MKKCLSRAKKFSKTIDTDTIIWYYVCVKQREVRQMVKTKEIENLKEVSSMLSINNLKYAIAVIEALAYAQRTPAQPLHNQYRRDRGDT
jgi:maltose-binding protein MalE